MHVNKYVLIVILICVMVLCIKYDHKDKHKYYSPEDKNNVYLAMISRAGRALDRLNIPFFLSSGTCLGYVREGKIIDHDYDIDIGIFREDYNEDIVKEFEKEGLVHVHTLGSLDDGYELKFILPDTIMGKFAKMDLFLHYRDNGKIKWYAYSPLDEKVTYSVTEFDVKRVNFNGVDVGVPDPTLRYIEEHYGDDWFKPKRPFLDYLYYDGPTSIVKDEEA